MLIREVRVIQPATLALAGGLVGMGLIAAAARFDDAAPLALLVISLLPILFAGILANPHLGVLAVFATFPMGSVVLPTPGVSLGLAEAAVLTVAGLIVIRRLAAGDTPLPWSPSLWWALAVFCWMLVALPSAVDEQLALKQIALWAGGMIFTIVVMASCPTMADVRRVIGGFLFFVTLLAAVGLSSAETFQAEYEATRVSGRLTGAFDHPNQLGAVCSLSFVLAVGLTLGARTTWARLAAAAAIPLLLGGLALSLTRGAWIGTLLAMAYLAVTLPQARRAIAAICIPLAVLAALLWPTLENNPQLQVVQQRFQAIATPSPYDERPQIWAEAMREIQADPWTGQGPGGFPVASARSDAGAIRVFAYHAHNVLLTWGAESGLPAVCFLIALGVGIALEARRGGRAAAERGSLQDRAIIAGLVASLIAMVGQGAVDFTWRNSIVFLAICGVLGALLAATSIQRRTADAERHHKVTTQRPVGS